MTIFDIPYFFCHHSVGGKNNSMIYALLFILLSFSGCQKEVTVPQYLIGVWKTAALEPDYEDRYLKFTKDSMIFGVGEGREVIHSIRKIKVKQKNSETLYTFYCTDPDGEKWTYTVTYKTDFGGIINLKGRDEIWKKVEPGGT
jgi:hypothetical protein